MHSNVTSPDGMHVCSTVPGPVTPRRGPAVINQRSIRYMYSIPFVHSPISSSPNCVPPIMHIRRCSSFPLWLLVFSVAAPRTNFQGFRVNAEGYIIEPHHLKGCKLYKVLPPISYQPGKCGHGDCQAQVWNKWYYYQCPECLQLTVSFPNNLVCDHHAPPSPRARL
jgi:hypothetical protein